MHIRSYLAYSLFSLCLLYACDNSSNKPATASASDEPALEEFRRVDVDSIHVPVSEMEQPKAEVVVATSEEGPIEEKMAEEKMAEENKPKPIKKKAVIVFDSLIYRLPAMYEGDKTSLDLVFTNEGDAPLSIKEVDVACGCTTPEVPFLDILPGDKGKIGIQYNSVGKEGLQEPEITVISNGIPRKTVLKIVVNIKKKKPQKDSTAISESKDTLPN